MAAVPVLADLKTQLNITNATNDSELTAMLQAAVELVGNFVGPLAPITTTRRVTTSFGGQVVLPDAPVVSVTTYATTDSSVIDTSKAYLDGAAGIVTGLPGTTVLDITYTAGWGTVPEPVFYATLLIAAHLWETQRGARPVRPMSGEDPNINVGYGFAIPNRAAEMLAPYKQVVVK